MPQPRGSWVPIIVRGGLLLAAALVAAWLAWFLNSDGLSRSDAAGIVLAVIGVAVAFATLWVAILQLRRTPTPPIDDADRLTQAADALATAVGEQLTMEVGRRALYPTMPLPVRWSTAVASTVAVPVLRLRQEGPVDDEIANTFLALGHRRLVVLGEPGAGKTVLAMLLTQALLDLRRRQPDVPVPVLLSVGSWDPTVDDLYTWLARRLSQEYPPLSTTINDAGTLQRLITSRRILLVLDGLDELPHPLRPIAIKALDKAVTNRPIVVTCRSKEYRQAVDTGGEVLASAAVVELKPVAANEAIAFLRGATPTPERWDQVATELQLHPRGPLASALSTPLMVALARTIYASVAANQGS